MGFAYRSDLHLVSLKVLLCERREEKDDLSLDYSEQAVVVPGTTLAGWT
jgi:hypothetical protein